MVVDQARVVIVRVRIGDRDGVELLGLGAAGQRRGRRLAARHRARDRIEVAHAHFALVAGRRVAEVLAGEFRLLQPRASSNMLWFRLWKPARVTN